jgi:hypothetical protein
MPTTNSTSVITTIIPFIESIGIPVVFDTITEKTFVPGILINKGSLIVDENQLLYPGDLLHEAGHMAVAIPNEREIMYGDVGTVAEKSKSDGEEMMAIAWSYAACIHLKIDPAVVFHPHGYQGSSDWYIEQYTSGNLLYLPLLQWAGFCYDATNAQAKGVKPFPEMIKWLRD